jgi:pimeloyl-ACP methyl ester carboxylesterase
MQFDELGRKDGKTLMLLPGTACDYQTNFGSVLDRLAEKYHLICVNYDGFDGSSLVFPDILTVTEKIEQNGWRVTFSKEMSARIAMVYAERTRGKNV